MRGERKVLYDEKEKKKKRENIVMWCNQFLSYERVQDLRSCV